ncbi:MAG: hypothetical protein JW929_00045 [Anaerolineales bacterium]|nr:hypothetical protein [Anaerolineales bacterium]
MGRKNGWIAALSFLALLCAGCTARPTFLQHPRPELSSDFSAFADAGCPPDENGLMLCFPGSPLAAFDCDRIERPDGLFGGLDPALPIAYCLFDSYRHSGEDFERVMQVEEEGFLYQTGGISQTYVRFVVFRDGEFQLLATREDFAAAFAPVDSANEALAYALAHGPYSAQYGLRFDRGLRYLAATVEDTYVAETDGGYRVHLFHYQFFGCGPHTTSSVDLRVATDGTVEEVKTEAVFQDPKEDSLCVD